MMINGAEKRQEFRTMGEKPAIPAAFAGFFLNFGAVSPFRPEISQGENRKINGKKKKLNDTY